MNEPKIVVRRVIGMGGACCSGLEFGLLMLVFIVLLMIAANTGTIMNNDW